MLKPVALVLAAGLVLTACSDSEGADQNGLLGALARVHASADTRESVEYGEPAAIAALAKKDKTEFRTTQGYGYGSVAAYSRVIEEKLGLDLTGFDGGIVAGDPPKQATALWGGYDMATVDSKLADLKIDSTKELGGTHWRAADDNELSLDGPFTEMAPPAQFNNIVTRDGLFAFASASAGIQAVTEPGDETLARDDVLVPLAACLGDVIAARLLATGEAAGVRRDGSDVICLDASRDHVSQALKDNVPSVQEPYEELLPGATVDEAEGLARVTVPPRAGEPSGRVLQMMLNRDLDPLKG